MYLPIAGPGDHSGGPFFDDDLGVVQVVLLHDQGGWVVRTVAGELWLIDKDRVAQLVERRRADGIDWTHLFPAG